MKTKYTKGYVVEVITDNTPKVEHALTSGYGIGAMATRLTGKPFEITVARDGTPVLSISITKEGHVHVTNCEGMFTHNFGTHLSLTNTRPWPTK